MSEPAPITEVMPSPSPTVDPPSQPTLRLDQLFTAAPEAILVVDASGAIRLANPRAEELFGYPPDALVGRSIDMLVPATLADVHARHRERYQAQPRRRLMGEDLELRGRRADGTEIPIDVGLGPAMIDGERYVIAIVRDITDHKLHQDELRYLSEHDTLTGLLNRRGFDPQLARAMAHACRHGIPTALLLADLDGFKPVNDRLGHPAGDKVLCEIASGLRARLRTGDTIARIGGDEFAIILPFAGPAAAEAIARDLLGVVRVAADVVTRGELALTASIGIVELGAPDQSVVGAIAAADAAMYRAKREGGDAVRVAAASPAHRSAA